MKKIFLSTAILVLAATVCPGGLAASNPPKPSVLGQQLLRFGTQGIGPGQITDLDHIAVDPQGFLYVSDYKLSRVQRFSREGKLDSLFYFEPGAYVRAPAGEPEEPVVPGKSMATEPVEPARLVAADPQGFLYTADPRTGRILRFNAQTQLEGPFELRSPGEPWTGLAVDRGGTLYIAAQDRLFRYDRTGRLLGEVRHPDGEGFFHVASRPDAGVLASWRNAGRDDLVLVAMDGRRNLFAASRRLQAVFLFKHNGEYVNRFGSEGDEPGQLSGSITGLAADGQGRIFVGDARRINVFLTEDGRFLRRREGGGSGLAVSDGDDVFAVNGTRIVRFPAGEPEED